MKQSTSLGSWNLNAHTEKIVQLNCFDFAPAKRREVEVEVSLEEF